MNIQNEIAILYSGGTDSTCAVAIMAQKFQKIHLLTFKRFGIYSVENASRNVNILRKKFPSNQFTHKIITVDRLAKHIIYFRFIQNIFKYGFFTLSNCVNCCLIHHFRILIYCLENHIANVADGATKEWPFFPSHMEKVILEFKKMYTHFKITYHTPVYNFGLSSAVRFIDKIYPIRKLDLDIGSNSDNYCKETTGNYLFTLGIFPLPNLKGTDLDHKMQPRCFQFILHHIYLYWYSMVRHDYVDFEFTTLQFIKQKINSFVNLIEKNTKRINEIIEG